MIRRASVLVILALVAGLAPSVPATAQVSPYTVRVTGGRFNPPTLDVPVGAQVTWIIEENGHTVSASDYRFDWEPNRTLNKYETRSWTFTADETVRYSCRVHAPGMSGIITVGAGSPPPPPPPPISGETRQVPSTQYPTVAAALNDIPPDSEVVLQPGTYPPFKVGVDDVLIRSATTPDEVVVDGSVVIDGGGIAKTGIVIEANRVRVRGISVRKAADHAVTLTGNDTELRYMIVDSGLKGAITVDGQRTRIADVSITGSAAAPGIELLGGDDVLVERVSVSGARAGVKAIGTDGVVVRNSTFAGTGAGIVLRSTPADRVIGGHLFRNTITSTNAPPLSITPELDPVTGAGIWLDGTWSVRTERNAIEASMTYGVAITSIVLPTLGARVLGNTISTSRIADLGWDGIGTACADQQGTTDPATGVPGCASGPSVGLPYPIVPAQLLLYAAFGPLI